MAKREKAPSPIVRKTARGIAPVSGYEAERLMADPVGTEYDLVKRSRRSNPHNALYWQVLEQVVRSTGKWPTKTHLHRDLKIICGYVAWGVDWDTGQAVRDVDSTAFEEMTQDEFNTYFETAMSKLAEHIGFDPLAYSEFAA